MDNVGTCIVHVILICVGEAIPLPPYKFACTCFRAVLELLLFSLYYGMYIRYIVSAVSQG